MSLLEYRRERRKFGRGEWVLFEGRPAKVMHPGVESAGGLPGRICLIAYRDGPDVVQKTWVPEDDLKKMSPEEKAAIILGAEEDWECPEEG